MRRISRSSRPCRRESITWSSQVRLRSTPKTKACTRCLSAGESCAREHSRSTRVSAKEWPSCQRIRQFRAVWREDGFFLFTGGLYMLGPQVSTSKSTRRGMACAAARTPGGCLTCLSAGFPLPCGKWPGAAGGAPCAFPPDCAFPPGLRLFGIKAIFPAGW